MNSIIYLLCSQGEAERGIEIATKILDCILQKLIAPPPLKKILVTPVDRYNFPENSMHL